MTVVFLYSEVMGYTLASLGALAVNGSDVHVVHWDHRKLTPFRLPSDTGITFYPRSQLSCSTASQLIEELKPDVLVISGWMDSAYLRIAARYRSSGLTTVLALDGQWEGRWRQRTMAALFRFGVRRALFSHAWVPGLPQYEYARKLGFSKSEIRGDLYSADVDLWNRVYRSARALRADRFPRRFVFVGRIEEVKGIRELLTAWAGIGDRQGWELHVIGEGSLASELRSLDGVVVHGFLQPAQLAEKFQTAGCLVLPSRREPWGVAIHEAAASGLPLIVPDIAGAASAFLIEGLNGYLFEVGSSSSLRECIRKVITRSDDQLRRMSEASHALAQRITPMTSAMNLLSVLSGKA